ncbi:unnamed protein product [Discosporangium mesarthrocarpum]
MLSGAAGGSLSQVGSGAGATLDGVGGVWDGGGGNKEVDGDGPNPAMSAPGPGSRSGLEGASSRLSQKPKRKRGRPPKNLPGREGVGATSLGVGVTGAQGSGGAVVSEVSSPPGKPEKRRRGRPRKTVPLDDEDWGRDGNDKGGEEVAAALTDSAGLLADMFEDIGVDGLVGFREDGRAMQQRPQPPDTMAGREEGKKGKGRKKK